MESEFLNDTWCLYYHGSNDSDWSRNSFKNLTNVSSIQQYWSAEREIVAELHLGMFFLMRESIFPLWEEKENRDGGYFSIKVLKTKAVEAWEELCALLLGETLLFDEHLDRWDLVNGISISPKKSFCIIKIWLRSKDLIEPSAYNIHKPEFGEIMFTPYQ